MVYSCISHIATTLKIGKYIILLQDEYIPIFCSYISQFYKSNFAISYSAHLRCTSDIYRHRLGSPSMLGSKKCTVTSVWNYTVRGADGWWKSICGYKLWKMWEMFSVYIIFSCVSCDTCGKCRYIMIYWWKSIMKYMIMFSQHVNIVSRTVDIFDNSCRSNGHKYGFHHTFTVSHIKWKETACDYLGAKLLWTGHGKKTL